MPCADDATQFARLDGLSRPASNGCIEWAGVTDTNGYGILKFRGKDRKAHRVAYIRAHGSIPRGMHVLHTCDNRKCINPEHLYAGTNAQNIADKVERDRSGKKLCIAKVREIKRLLKTCTPQSQIASMYGVNQCIVSRISTGVRWSHVPT